MNYKFNKLKYFLANLLELIITFGAILITIFIYSPIEYSGSVVSLLLQIGLNFGLLIFLLFLSIPSYILAYQYYKNSYNIELEFLIDKIKIYDKSFDNIELINKSDIQRITYVDPKLNWYNALAYRSYSYLVLHTHNKEYILTCFVISKKDFFRHYERIKNITENDAYIPFIKPAYYRYLEKQFALDLSQSNNDPIQITPLIYDLAKYIIIGGLVIYTVFAYFFGQTWVIVSSVVTIAISFFLLRHKKIFISGSDIIISYFSKKTKYSLSDIITIKELKWTKILSLNLSEPMIKLSLRDKNGVTKTIFLFTRKTVYSVLKNKLLLE